MRTYEWETPRCGFCGGTENSLYMESTVPKWYEKKPLRLITCDGCGLVYASPRPLEEDLYKEYMEAHKWARNVYHRKIEQPRGKTKNRGKIIKTAMSFLEKPTGKLFDVGFGAGQLLIEARDHGLVATGNEINQYACDKLAEQGFDVKCELTKNLNEKENTYDIVTMIDYFEHSFYPYRDLQFAHGILKENGVMYLETLYLGSPQHKESGEKWGLFGLAHFNFFFPEVLRKMVQQAGFHIVSEELTHLITIVAKKISH